MTDFAFDPVLIGERQTRRAVIAVDDERIISLFYSRDEQALRETDSRYGALCRSVARNILGSSEDAKECVSDALLTAWNAIPPAKPRNYCAYLMKLVRGHAVNRWHANRAEKRGGGQTPAALDELAECISARETVESESDRRALLEAITAFLGTLPEQQRHLFVRRYWYTDPVQVLARDFGMSENRISVTLSRIRKRLHTYLEKEGLL